MKNHSLYFFMLLSATLLLSSCSDDEDKKSCGDERITAFPTMTPAQFDEYFLDPTTFGDATYETDYVRQNNIAYFDFATSVVHVCPYQDILVSPTLLLNTADANIRDTLTIRSPGGNELKTNILPSTGTVYMSDEVYTFTTSANETSVKIINSISFPSQGSVAADSAYFFGNLASFGFSMQYNTIP